SVSRVSAAVVIHASSHQLPVGVSTPAKPRCSAACATCTRYSSDGSRREAGSVGATSRPSPAVGRNQWTRTPDLVTHLTYRDEPWCDNGVMNAPFEPFGADTWRDPHPVYRTLREEDPVHWSSKLGCFVLTRFEDVFRTARDTYSVSPR